MTNEQLDELINRLDEIAVRSPWRVVEGDDDGEYVPVDPEARQEMVAFDDALTQSQRVALAEELERRWEAAKRDGAPWLQGGAFQYACEMAYGPRCVEDEIRIARRVAESEGGTLRVVVWNDVDEWWDGKAPRDVWDDDGTMPGFDLDGELRTYCLLPNGEVLTMDVEPTGDVGISLSRAQLGAFAGRLGEAGVSAEVRPRASNVVDEAAGVH